MKKLIAAIAALVMACNHIPAPQDPMVAQLKSPAPEYTPLTVVDGVFMLTATIDGVRAWSGTGWKLDATHLMTAGHVCDLDGATGVLALKATTRWNAEYPAKVVKFSRTPDLCLLEGEFPGPNLNKFVPVPEYGADVWYLGAPHGVWGDGTAPFAKGFYIGGDRAFIGGYPGASGSLMFTKDGVFGILVRGYRGTHLIEFETAAEMAQFLAAK